MRDLFVREYLKVANATRAAILAGYSSKTAASQGQRLLKSAAVGDEIARARTTQLKNEEASVENIVRELAIMAFLDPADLFDKKGVPLPLNEMPEARRGLTGFKIENLFASHSGRKRRIGRRYTVHFSGKIKALTMLAKYLGMLPRANGVSGKHGKPRAPADSRELPIEVVRDMLQRSTSEIQTPLKPPPPKLLGKPPSRLGMKGRDSVMRQQFPIEYLKDFNATKAAVRAGYSPKTAASQGQRLLKSAGVGEASAELSARVVEKNEVTRERVLKELAAIAFLNPIEYFDGNDRLLPINQMPEHARRALASLNIVEWCDRRRRKKTHVSVVYKIRPSSKPAAPELLAKIEGMFP
jgi:phage terminase small subunit